MQPSNTELILIRVTGEDRPGLTASVTEILAKYDRSEERRVGKECSEPCRSRWSPYH